MSNKSSSTPPQAPKIPGDIDKKGYVPPPPPKPPTPPIPPPSPDKTSKS